jgi:uncharacterized repeat protein (TIGR03803 family)
MNPRPRRQTNANRHSCGLNRTIFLILGLIMFAVPRTQAQTYSVIHAFTGSDGSSPAGLTMDRVGHLFGTTAAGGNTDRGTVFRLVNNNGNWILNPLYSFAGGQDGWEPTSGVIISPSGTLYGATSVGGNYCLAGAGCGTLFQLTPPPTACVTVVCPWSKKTVYAFSGSDGQSPSGGLALDQVGNIYGTTESGGLYEEYCTEGCGVVFQLSPRNGGWVESLLHEFTDGSDGEGPSGGVVLDSSANLYGTATLGGRGCHSLGCGTVFQLAQSGSNWQMNILYSFSGEPDGQYPTAGVVLDTAGNLYGVTYQGGLGGGGTAFELMPSSGTWMFDLLYSFAGTPDPFANLTLDAAGDIYGTTYYGGPYGNGTVFKLMRGINGWTYEELHGFTGGLDGAKPRGSVIVDAEGNLYGTAEAGGGTGCNGQGCGVVWEIRP